MLKGLFGLGPPTVDIATLSFLLSSEADLSTVHKRTFDGAPLALAVVALTVGDTQDIPQETKELADYLFKLRRFRLGVDIVTDKTGLSLTRLTCLTYLLSVERQMRVLSRHHKERLLKSLYIALATPARWEPAVPDPDKMGVAPYPVLSVSVRVRYREVPFVTFHPRLLSRFPGGIEPAVVEFLRAFLDHLRFSVPLADLEYIKEGLRSLLSYWEAYGIPRIWSPTPALPFLLQWRQ